MPQTVTVSWVEVGDATGLKIINSPEATFWPSDAIIFTSIKVDPSTGRLIWTTEDDYELGSVLSLKNGRLIQTTTDGFTVAGLEIIDGNTLQATLNVGG